MNLKILTKILLVFSAVLLPFWITGAVFLFSIFYFEDFYFGVFVMFFLDLLYGFETIFLFGIPGVVFLSSVLLFGALFLIKKFVNIRK